MGRSPTSCARPRGPCCSPLAGASAPTCGTCARSTPRASRRPPAPTMTGCSQAGFSALVLRATGAAVDDMGFAYQAQAIAESVGGQNVKAIAQATLSAAHLAAGQPVEAAEAAQRSIALIEKTSTVRDWEA